MTFLKFILCSVISISCTLVVMTIVHRNQLQPPRSETVMALDILAAISAYHQEFGYFPVTRGGVLLDNLTGMIPRRTVFLEHDSGKSDTHGRILNSHGVPFYFGLADGTIHLVSFSAMPDARPTGLMGHVYSRQIQLQIPPNGTVFQGEGGVPP